MNFYHAHMNSKRNNDMQLRLTGIIYLLCAFLLLGCSEEVDNSVTGNDQKVATAEQKASAPVFQSISVTEVHKLIQQKTELSLIDVRTPQERKQMRIAGSQLVPVGDVIRGKASFPPEKPIILVCAVGGRSYIAGKALASYGYSRIYNMEGGIEAWHRAGLPLQHGPEPALSGSEVKTKTKSP
jgi:rhodanese-related sulfurtransferase